MLNASALCKAPGRARCAWLPGCSIYLLDDFGHHAHGPTQWKAKMSYLEAMGPEMASLIETTIEDL